MAIRSNLKNKIPSSKIPEDVRKEQLFRDFKTSKSQKQGVDILRSKVMTKGPKRIDILFDG